MVERAVVVHQKQSLSAMTKLIGGRERCGGCHRNQSIEGTEVKGQNFPKFWYRWLECPLWNQRGRPGSLLKGGGVG